MTVTAIEAGLMDLQEAGAKMTKQALAMKLMENLKCVGVGTNEVESKAWERVRQRHVKDGNIRKAKEIRNGGRNHQERDAKYVKGILNLRQEQAREDWNRERERYRKSKAKLINGAEHCGQSNMIKREIKRIEEENN